jgi:hypothetical protein
MPNRLEPTRLEVYDNRLLCRQETRNLDLRGLRFSCHSLRAHILSFSPFQVHRVPVLEGIWPRDPGRQLPHFLSPLGGKASAH